MILLLKSTPPSLLLKAIPELKGMEWGTSIKFTSAEALTFGFPPTIFTTGVLTKSNPLSTILISESIPSTETVPFAPEPKLSVIFNTGGLITS